MKPAIREVIVVEGMHDSAHLKRYFDCETIITGGMGIDEAVMDEIRNAAKRTGIILFTDPDGPGERIRRKIEAEIPGCRHAFVMKQDARTEHKVGVEHAGYAALKEALDHTVTWVDSKEETISAAEFYALGLSGNDRSEEKRSVVAHALHIGYANAKTLRARMNRLGVTVNEVKGILDEWESQSRASRGQEKY